MVVAARAMEVFIVGPVLVVLLLLRRGGGLRKDVRRMEGLWRGSERGREK